MFFYSLNKGVTDFMKRKNIFRFLLILVLMCFPWLCQAEMSLSNEVESDMAYLLNLYKHLHENPELSLQEVNTAQRLALEFESSGYSVSRNIGGHGVVAILKNGAGPTLLLRTDMDALPIKEETGLPYQSQVMSKNRSDQDVSVMHACGHDMHMSVVVGAARYLSQNKNKWRGTLMIIAEPAEEIGAGSRAMLADGLFTQFPRPDFNLAYHVSPELPAGSIGYVRGFSMANVDSVDISVKGSGGHGAYPHKTKDPIVMAASLVLQLQTITSRELSPLESAVVTVGSIHGGTKHNIISDEVKLQLTVRSYSDDTREFLLKRITEISEGVARTAGMPEDRLPLVQVKDEYTPSVYNNPELIDRLIPVLQSTLGENNLKAVAPVMAGEDFSRYGRVDPKIPSVLFWLGSVNQKDYHEAQEKQLILPSLHSNKFAPDPERTMKTGVQALVRMTTHLLQ